VPKVACELEALLEQLILYSTEVRRDMVLNSSKASSDLKKLSKHSMIMCDSCQTV